MVVEGDKDKEVPCHILVVVVVHLCMDSVFYYAHLLHTNQDSLDHLHHRTHPVMERKEREGQR